MKIERKARAELLASDLQKSVSHEAMAAKELVGLLFETAKHNLVAASGDDVLRLQGEARAMERLHTSLTRASPLTGKE